MNTPKLNEVNLKLYKAVQDFKGDKADYEVRKVALNDDAILVDIFAEFTYLDKKYNIFKVLVAYLEDLLEGDQFKDFKVGTKRTIYTYGDGKVDKGKICLFIQHLSDIKEVEFVVNEYDNNGFVGRIVLPFAILSP